MRILFTTVTFTLDQLGLLVDRPGHWTFSWTRDFGFLLERLGIPVWAQGGIFDTPEGPCPVRRRVGP